MTPPSVAQQLIFALNPNVGIEALFRSSVQGDYYQDPDSMRLFITQSGLGLPDPDYYNDQKVEEIYEEIVKNAMTSIYTDFANSRTFKLPKKPSIDVKAKEIFAFEKKLAGSFWDKWVHLALCITSIQ